jgi:hypothetical protein
MAELQNVVESEKSDLQSGRVNVLINSSTDNAIKLINNLMYQIL